MLKSVCLLMAAANTATGILSGDMNYTISALLWFLIFECEEIISKLTIKVDVNKFDGTKGKGYQPHKTNTKSVPPGPD